MKHYNIAICIHMRKKFGRFQFGGCEGKLSKADSESDFLVPFCVR